MRLAAFLLTLLLAGQAQAAAVTNLSDRPEEIGVWNGSAYVVEVIQPNDTWRINAQVRVRYRDRENFIGAYEQYAIWQDGTFGPQHILFKQNGQALR
ncbi:MAG: hypothetical protein EBV03_03575 [Proteobacteria bacterium]|nr:hypothetical protein [Pseudomonadota bacterium]